MSTPVSFSFGVLICSVLLAAGLPAVLSAIVVALFVLVFLTQGRDGAGEGGGNCAGWVCILSA